MDVHTEGYCGTRQMRALEISASFFLCLLFGFPILSDIVSFFPQVRAMRLSFVGEMGWELHVPKEHCVRVYQSVLQAGAKHGIANAGYRAIDSLSIEKGVWEKYSCLF